jgi:hypothetical protein
MNKDKRQKRFQQKKRHMQRQYDIWNAYMNRDGRHYREPHRFHKTHALNCGDPKCVMCMNPRKSFGEKTFQERRFECLPIEELNTP